MMGMPVAEIPESPVRRKSLAELAQVIDVETEVSVVALCVRSGLCRKQDDREFVPAAEQVTARLNRPCRSLGSNGPQFDSQVRAPHSAL